MVLGKCLVEYQRVINFASQVTLILPKHVIKGVLGWLGQVAGLENASVPLHLEMRLLGAYHGPEKRRHAGLLLKSAHSFLFVVGPWSNGRSCTFARDIVYRTVVESLVVAERATSRF